MITGPKKLGVFGGKLFVYNVGEVWFGKGKGWLELLQNFNNIQLSVLWLI